MSADEEVNKGFRALGQEKIALSRLPVHSFGVQEQESTFYLGFTKKLLASLYNIDNDNAPCGLFEL